MLVTETKVFKFLAGRSSGYRYSATRDAQMFDSIRAGLMLEGHELFPLDITCGDHRLLHFDEALISIRNLTRQSRQDCSGQ